MGKRPVGPLRRKFIRPKKGMNLELILREEASSFKAKNETEFLEAVSGSRGVSLKEITSRFNNGPYLVRKWIKAGVLESYNSTVFREPSGKTLVPSSEPSNLYDLGIRSEHNRPSHDDDASNLWGTVGAVLFLEALWQAAMAALRNGTHGRVRRGDVPDRAVFIRVCYDCQSRIFIDLLAAT